MQSLQEVAELPSAAGEFDMTRQKQTSAMRVMDTGSNLAALARALSDDGVKTEFHDNRKEEKISLKSRIKGARQLFGTVKEDNLAGWDKEDIHAKRTMLYEAMVAEVESGGMMPSVSLSSLFEKRL